MRNLALQPPFADWMQLQALMLKSCHPGWQLALLGQAWQLPLPVCSKAEHRGLDKTRHGHRQLQ